MKNIDLIRLIWDNIDVEEFDKTLKEYVEENQDSGLKLRKLFKDTEKYIRPSLEEGRGFVCLHSGHDFILHNGLKIVTAGIRIAFDKNELDINFFEDGVVVLMDYNESHNEDQNKDFFIPREEFYEEDIMLTMRYGRMVVKEI